MRVGINDQRDRSTISNLTHDQMMSVSRLLREGGKLGDPSRLDQAAVDYTKEVPLSPPSLINNAAITMR
jgi:hypothetical protein